MPTVFMLTDFRAIKKISRDFNFCFVKKNGVCFDKFTFLVKTELINICVKKSFFFPVFKRFNIS